MNTKTTLLLSFLFLIITSLAFLEMTKWKPNRIEYSIRSQTVLELKDNHFEWIEIQVKGKKKIRLECKERSFCDFSSKNKWEISEPIKAPGDSLKIAATLAHFKQLDFIRELDLATELNNTEALDKEFGLESPEAWLRIKIKEKNKPILVRLGNKSPIGSHFYVSNNHKPSRVFILRNYFIRVISHDTFYWRDKRLFPKIKSAEIKKLHWKYLDKAPISLERKKNGEWWILEPKKAPADTTLINGMLSITVNAKIKSILSTEKIKKINHKKQLHFSFFTKDKEKHLIDFWSSQQKKFYLLKSSSQAWLATVEKEPYKVFEKNYKKYLQTSLFSKRLKEKAFALEWSFSKNTSISIRKDLDGWKGAEELDLHDFSQFWELAFRPTLQRSASPQEAFVQEIKKKNSPIQLKVYEKNRNYFQKYTFWLHQRGEVLVKREASSLYWIMGKNLAKVIPRSKKNWMKEKKKAKKKKL